MTTPRRSVGVVFGGPSVEHDVSIITAQQVMAVAGERHDVVPIYVATDGRWWTGPSLLEVSSFAAQPPTGARPVELRLGRSVPLVMPASGRFGKDQELRLDVVINAIHGTGGEDGALLGALELARVPHVGRGVAAAAVTMDKHLSKAVLRDAGFDVLPHVRVERAAWEADEEAVVARIRGEITTDVVVKPATLGSSIGVARCRDDDELTDALQLALELDRQVIVEPFAAGATELNVAVLGRVGEAPLVSEVERPIGGEAGLSFEDKYLSGAKGKGGKAATGKGAGMATQGRVIPADVPAEWRDRVKALAAGAHAALRLSGVVRYDFFVLDDGARFVINEPNTVPGSFAFYLFEPDGMTFDLLVERLIEIAVAEQQEERSTVRAFESALLKRHIGA